MSLKTGLDVISRGVFPVLAFGVLLLPSTPAQAAPQHFERHFAEWLFDRILARRDCGTIFAPDVGMAANVLDRRVACAASALHPDESTGVGSLEATSCCFYWRSIACRCGAMAAVPLFGSVDDIHDVLVARDTGFVSGLLAGGAQSFSGKPREHCDDLQRRRSGGRGPVWLVVASGWTTQRDACGAGPFAARDSSVGVQRIADRSGCWRVCDADGSAGGVGSDSSAPE